MNTDMNTDINTDITNKRKYIYETHPNLHILCKCIMCKNTNIKKQKTLYKDIVIYEPILPVSSINTVVSSSINNPSLTDISTLFNNNDLSKYYMYNNIKIKISIYKQDISNIVIFIDIPYNIYIKIRTDGTYIMYQSLYKKDYTRDGYFRNILHSSQNEKTLVIGITESIDIITKLKNREFLNSQTITHYIYNLSFNRHKNYISNIEFYKFKMDIKELKTSIPYHYDIYGITDYYNLTDNNL